METENNEMALEEKLREALRYPAPVSIVTVGADGSHLVGVWSSEVLALDLKTILIPARGMHKTEENIKGGSDVKMLVARPAAEGSMGAGSGFRITGRAEVLAEGPQYELIRSVFQWARAAMVVSVEKVEQLA